MNVIHHAPSTLRPATDSHFAAGKASAKSTAVAPGGSLHQDTILRQNPGTAARLLGGSASADGAAGNPKPEDEKNGTSKGLKVAITGAAISIGLLGYAVIIFLQYLILKAAVRNGTKEAFKSMTPLPVVNTN